MQRQFPLINGNLLTGGFGLMGFTGTINTHIKGVERVSDTEVIWTVENMYGDEYTITVTADIPEVSGEPDKTKRVDPEYVIAEVSS